MLERLTALFASPPAKPEPLPEPDARAALAALLVRIAQSDNHYAAAEISEIDQILAKAFDLGPIDAAKLRALAEKLEKAAPATGTFTAIIRSHVEYDQRRDALDAFWAVVRADGRRLPEEEATLASISDALGITAEDAAAARARAILRE